MRSAYWNFLKDSTDFDEWPTWAYLTNLPIFLPITLTMYPMYQTYCDHVGKLASYEELQLYEDYNWGLTYPNKQLLEKIDEEIPGQTLKKMREKDEREQRYIDGNPQNRREAAIFWLEDWFGREPGSHVEKIEKLPHLDFQPEVEDE